MKTPLFLAFSLILLCLIVQGHHHHHISEEAFNKTKNCTFKGYNITYSQENNGFFPFHSNYHQENANGNNERHKWQQHLANKLKEHGEEMNRKWHHFRSRHPIWLIIVIIVVKILFLIMLICCVVKCIRRCRRRRGRCCRRHCRRQEESQQSSNQNSMFSDPNSSFRPPPPPPIQYQYPPQQQVIPNSIPMPMNYLPSQGPPMQNYQNNGPLYYGVPINPQERRQFYPPPPPPPPQQFHNFDQISYPPPNQMMVNENKGGLQYPKI